MTTETNTETTSFTIRDELEGYFTMLDADEELFADEVAADLHGNVSTIRDQLNALAEDGVIVKWEGSGWASYAPVPTAVRGKASVTGEFTAFLLTGVDPKEDRAKAQALRKLVEERTGFPVRFHHDRWHKNGACIRVKLTVPKAELKDVRARYARGDRRTAEQVEQADAA